MNRIRALRTHLKVLQATVRVLEPSIQDPGIINDLNQLLRKLTLNYDMDDTTCRNNYVIQYIARDIELFFDDPFEERELSTYLQLPLYYIIDEFGQDYFAELELSDPPEQLEAVRKAVAMVQAKVKYGPK